ncbi:cell envelope integrity TolA C-terminal domain-containing protein [Erwinia mallotivora]|uniref:cell envelope integrity TolA C-terminal domain-containing protein n=1 Tax=Erwinia mallotivora TaxID=69222 RepID=UPI0021C0009F|nr:cell envelope integrity TolA C-terminal domain-containing protein [Erwinia mallotivora]
MTSGKKIIAGCLLPGMLLLAGCQSATQAGREKQPPPTRQQMQTVAERQCSKKQDGLTHQQCLYYTQMQYGFQHNFYDAERYKGRRCAVTVGWHNGRYVVLSTQGDEILCLKSWSVIGSAENLPPPPAGFPPQMVIDFTPR